MEELLQLSHFIRKVIKPMERLLVHFHQYFDLPTLSIWLAATEENKSRKHYLFCSYKEKNVKKILPGKIISIYGKSREQTRRVAFPFHSLVNRLQSARRCRTGSSPSRELRTLLEEGSFKRAAVDFRVAQFNSHHLRHTRPF